MINIQLTVTPATPTLLNNAKPENVLDTLLDELQTFTNPNSDNRSGCAESKSHLQRNQQRKSLELRKKNGKPNSQSSPSAVC